MAFAALSAGVSGLQAFTEGIGTVADNITNVNTIGYKESRTQFTTLVTETQAVTSYAPGGVAAVAQTLVSRQGLLTPSSSETDLSVDGAGFFVARKAPSALSTEGEVLFTRAGNFTPDEQGFLKNTAGLFLQGWPVDAEGNIPTNLGDLSALQPINVSGLTGTAEATSEVFLRANFQSSEPVYGGTPPYAVGNLATGSVEADFERTIEVFDAQGATHTLVLAALHTGVNEWQVEVYASPASDVTQANGVVLSGTLGFNTNGSLKTSGGAPVTSASLLSPATLTYTNGASPGSISFNFGSDGDVDGFTQFESVSTLISTNVNGAVFGNVIGVNISEDGNVTALFDNGLTRNVFRLPVATFQNPDGLTRRQGNAYSVSDMSGNFSLVEPGTGGGGSIAPSTLEASTVDLANEFSKLIVTQRAFSASTRIITTADEILEELVRI